MDLDKLTVEEIKQMIVEGKITNQDVVEWYGNEWWDETP